MTDEQIQVLRESLLIMSDSSFQLSAMTSAGVTKDDLYIMDITAAKERRDTAHEEHLGQDPVCAVCGNLGPADPAPNFYWHPLCALDRATFAAGPVSADVDQSIDPAATDAAVDYEAGNSEAF
jgi:hypothetical protein